jgi:uncharacterized protein YbcI
MSGTDHHPPARALSRAANISNRVVQLMSTYTGRGPPKAWTSIDQDLASVVLRDPLTKGERSLVPDGRSELVLTMRKAYQGTMRDELVAAVEQQAGRTVIAFLSDNHIDPDGAIESLLLEFLGGAPPVQRRLRRSRRAGIVGSPGGWGARERQVRARIVPSASLRP